MAIKMNKPFAESCEQNKQVILEAIRDVFRDRKQVLEIGSGTGQHAVFFAAQLPHLVWHTSDVAQHHSGINAWINDTGLSNVIPPLDLDVNNANWPHMEGIDACFTANTLHIMSWSSVINFFQGISRTLPARAALCIYGPFNYDGQFTSESNRNFDQWLKARDPQSGIRDMNDLLELGKKTGFELTQDIAMPANNRTLIWLKI